MKKISCLILSLLMCLCVLCFSVSAQSINVVDEADLLTAQEEAELQDTINRISGGYAFDVVILIVNSTEGKSSEEFVEDYHYFHNGNDLEAEWSDVLFLVSLEDRDWYISTAGKGVELITDIELDYIEQEIIPLLSQGDYYNCFDEFVSTCEEIVEYNTRGESFVEIKGYGDEYYVGHIPDFEGPTESFNFFKNALIALVVGFVIALIVVLSMKSKLRTVRAKSGASDYVVAGSMNITRSDERFLYRNVTRTPRQQNNSNGRSGGGGGVRVSSSGGSHGGRGGKF